MENSKIEWTDHTFNSWWGCMKVSDGCKNCYAAVLDNRYNKADPHWGPNSHRKMQSDKYWAQPLKWNQAAKEAGVNAKVFCSSMADVFEDHPETIEARKRLWQLIHDTPHLTWLLLTKRPENIMGFVPVDWLLNGFPKHVWLGTSVENQAMANLRIPFLLKVPAAIRFLSMEPLLGPVDLTAIEVKMANCLWQFNSLEIESDEFVLDDCEFHGKRINWVIVGGESGHGARPMHPDWVRSLKDQCKEADVKFFFKQWGEWVTRGQLSPGITIENIQGKLYQFDNGYTMCYRLGKHAAGRVLDGVEYNEMPTTLTAI